MALSLRARLGSYLGPIEPLTYTLRTYSTTSGAKGSIRSKDVIVWLDEGFALWYKTLSTSRFCIPFIQLPAAGASGQVQLPNTATTDVLENLDVHFTQIEGNTVMPKLVALAEGTVLELGPGLGNQLPRFDKNRTNHVYGVEPNEFLVPDLHEMAASSGIQGKYTIITCGIEDTDVLEKNGIDAGTIDTILSIQVLCSVEKPEAVIKALYKLLKPRGKLIFWEHHRSHDWLTRLVQSFWRGPWSLLIGGCRINRDIVTILKSAGDLERVDSLGSDEEPSSILPRSWGTLVKPA
ncbi:putative Methyltransferase type 11 domain-containing protein [Seiridium unicorne]|uniref:Methyltransferase type 11 domain-containing protein n=1 Tax=Seiridium unicorne TaxID=138068 RepID=A0ABR2V7X3_9PEZI